MRFINKRGRREPRSLVTYRATADLSAKDILSSYAKKHELRDALLKEQGYICCYCMRRIKGERDPATGVVDTKIEHWAPQSVYNGKVKTPDLRLNYKNLIAACLGNEGEPKSNQHCDTRKGEKEITINPVDLSCESKLYYGGSSGKILAYDPVIQKEIGESDMKKGILNLNRQTFRDNRYSALKAIYDLMRSEKPEGEWRKPFIQKNIDKISQKKESGYHHEYIGYILYFLAKRLERARP